MMLTMRSIIVVVVLISTTIIQRVSSKILINSHHTCVDDIIEGMVMTNKNLKRLGTLNIIVRSDIEELKKHQVTIISGGGSGHEPAHAGYVGDGMLSAAVFGNIFASPSVSSVLAAIRVTAGPKGVLIIVKNYTGDRLNFGMAVEKAKQEGINARIVIVNDDSALDQNKGITGARGIAGTVLVHKIAGAAAAELRSLDEVFNIVTSAIEGVRSMGVALSSCVIPGSQSEPRLPHSSPLYEVGMGIHGEPGRATATLPTENTASEVGEIIVHGIITRLRSEAGISSTEAMEVVMLVNNLGILSALELNVMVRVMTATLQKNNIKIARVLSGTFMTALNMNGVSLSLLRLPVDEPARMTFIRYIDHPTNAPAWAVASVPPIDATILTTLVDYNAKEIMALGGFECPTADLVLIRNICDRLIEKEPLFTAYDAACGDGDFGLVLQKGALAVRQMIKTLIDRTMIGEVVRSAYLCQNIAIAVSDTMGGTSGALIELFFRASTAYMTQLDSKTEADWISTTAQGSKALQLYGGAGVGMRTLLDALLPAIEALVAGEGLGSATRAARDGAERTKSMRGRAGRSSYISQAEMEGVPDPGAAAVAEIFDVIASAYSQ